MTKKLKIAVIGTGYVGLVTGTCLAELGHDVVCIDREQEKIQKLRAGEIPFFEPGLKELVEKNITNRRLSFSNLLAEALTQEVIFIAVGTPTDPHSGKTDLRQVESLARELASLLNPAEYKFIVVKSTVPVGTSDFIKKIIYDINPKANFAVISNPEFLREGSAVYDFMNPDRIIVGSDLPKGLEKMRVMYDRFFEDNIPFVETNNKTSEMIKYVANCFLATKLGFINEIAGLSEQLDTNIEHIVQGISLDKRIGQHFLQPGPGFGGSCFPKDTEAFATMAKEAGYSTSVIEAVIQSNRRRKQDMIEKIVKASGGSIQNKRITILGVTFKANTDDIRESPSISVMQGLLQQGAMLTAYDPAHPVQAKNMFPTIDWKQSMMESVKNAEVLVICTEWDEFKDLDFSKIKSLMNQTTIPPILIDLRNLYEPKQIINFGFRYASLGRATKEPVL